MTQFDWQTEEQHDWNAPLPDNTPPEKPLWHKLALAVAIVAILAASAFFITRRLNEQVAQGTAATREDVRASFELFHSVMARREIGVFNALLSGRDNEWTLTQQRLFINDNIFNRSLMGLELSDGQPELVDLTLAPDFKAASLTQTTAYTIDIGNNLTEAVQLQQIITFRRGQSRWLFSPEDTDFWGTQETLNGEYLTLEYPARDADIMLKLFADLERVVADLCSAEPLLPCHPHQTPLIHFTSDPTSLLKIQSLEAFLTANETTQASRVLELPTPSLVGTPLNDGSYDALARGYSRLLLTAISAHDYDCCFSIAYTDAILNNLFAKTGIGPAPLTQANYTQLLDTNPSFLDNDVLWNQQSLSQQTEMEKILVAVTIEHLQVTFPAISSADMLGEVGQPGTNFLQWIGALFVNQGVPVAQTIDILEARWQFFLQYQIDQSAALPPKKMVSSSPQFAM